MSLVAIALNSLLAGLLILALILGMRLNQRLKALRDSQLSFARAITDLNAATTRAERGLADLRFASEEAAEGLGQQIDAARLLASRLERHTQSLGSASLRDVSGGPDPEGSKLGALLSGARQPRPRPEPEREIRRSDPLARRPGLYDEDIFDRDGDLPPGRPTPGGRA